MYPILDTGDVQISFEHFQYILITNDNDDKEKLCNGLGALLTKLDVSAPSTVGLALKLSLFYSLLPNVEIIKDYDKVDKWVEDTISYYRSNIPNSYVTEQLYSLDIRKEICEYAPMLYGYAYELYIDYTSSSPRINPYAYTFLLGELECSTEDAKVLDVAEKVYLRNRVVNNFSVKDSIVLRALLSVESGYIPNDYSTLYDYLSGYLNHINEV